MNTKYAQNPPNILRELARNYLILMRQFRCAAGCRIMLSYFGGHILEAYLGLIDALRVRVFRFYIVNQSRRLPTTWRENNSLPCHTGMLSIHIPAYKTTLTLS